MAAAIVVGSAQVTKPTAIVPTGTGFATNAASTVTVTGPNTNMCDVLVKVTSSGGGAIDPKLTITPNGPGIIKITMFDGTTTVEQDVEVWDAA